MPNDENEGITKGKKQKRRTDGTAGRIPLYRQLHDKSYHDQAVVSIGQRSGV